MWNIRFQYLIAKSIFNYELSRTFDQVHYYSSLFHLLEGMLTIIYKYKTQTWECAERRITNNIKNRIRIENRLEKWSRMNNVKFNLKVRKVQPMQRWNQMDKSNKLTNCSPKVMENHFPMLHVAASLKLNTTQQSDAVLQKAHNSPRTDKKQGKKIIWSV